MNKEEVKADSKKQAEGQDQDGDAQFDTNFEEQQKIIGLTTKEIKNLAKPEFAKNPEKFYPTKIFEKIGFHRSSCPKCKANYWRKSEKQDTCGDSNCVGRYSFIGKGTGIGRKGKKITYAEAWRTFEKSFTSARVPCKSIARYPVVARWRNDVDYVAAGIYCFQPYCVTGELEPPANPLICPQFCVRFNDLDNIGLTGRHYSGFIMTGIQVFNYPDKFVFFKEECVEFNYKWLTEELEIDPEEITFVEDVWAGGGNLGPSIEYFINGLELGNMVFMQYKTFHDGTREELPIKVIDTGIGHDRIPWLINGSLTSYDETFKSALAFMKEKLQISVNTEVWEKFAPYSCLLNVDEIEGGVDKIWDFISTKTGIESNKIKEAIAPIKDLYVILDHTRSVFMIISDGSLPSNVGGGSNCRNILRRAFALLEQRGWMKVLKLEGFLELFEFHKKDLEDLYGKFPEYKSFNKIIKIEYERFLTTESESKAKLEKMLKKTPILKIKDWITAIQSFGIPAETIQLITKQPIPDTLHYEIFENKNREYKKPEQVLYNTATLPETEHMYYKESVDESLYEFKSKIVSIIPNLQQNLINNIVVLEKSQFYPTAGGQQHDTGVMKIDGVEYKVVNCEQVGKVVFHILDQALPQSPEHYIGLEVCGSLDIARRKQLRNHHTGTHIIFAACRAVLGPHVWQHGAKKTVDQAHLDITHYTSLTYEEEMAIENEANKIVLSGKPIKKYHCNKAEAEKSFGFRLYQGGIVPGNSLRVVRIEDTDVEACCGTHCDNTSEVGWIKLLKTQRISDGIVRLYYVAGERTIDKLNNQTVILTKIQDLWKVGLNDLTKTAQRFFKDYKKQTEKIEQQNAQIFSLQLKYVLKTEEKCVYMISDAPNPTIFFQNMTKFAAQIKNLQKNLVFIGSTFVFGLFSNKDAINFDKLQQVMKEDNEKVELKQQNKLTLIVDKKKEVIDNIVQFSILGTVKQQKFQQFFKVSDFVEITLD